MIKINTLEEWQVLATTLHSEGCRRWITQYYTQHPEGFHAWFWRSEEDDIEVVTHNDEVYMAIMNYKNGEK